MPSTEQQILSRLLAEIETAWEEHGDASLAERLASEHPQYAEELFAFMDAILEEDAELPTGAGAAAVRQTLNWLAEERREEAVAATPEREPAGAAAGPPQDLVGLLVNESGREPMEIVQAIADTTLELLAVFAQYPRLVKPLARRAFATRAERGLGVDRRQILTKFEEPQPLARAASRRGGYGAEPQSYEDLLDLAGLRGELRALWRRLGDEVEEEIR